MFSADQLNSKIRKAATQLGVQDVNRVRGIVTLERIVARLMTRPFLKEHLVFGGGFVLFKELATERYTRDADAVIKGVHPENLKAEIKKALEENLDDGFWFGDMYEEDLEAESGYGGIRFNILYKVGAPFPTEKEKARLRRIHLDISIGVDLEGVALKSSSASILDILSPIEWKIYPPEFIASEKIHCLLFRGNQNSRGKDVYDLPLIFKEVSDEALLEAIRITFDRRKFEVASMFDVAREIDTKNLKTSYGLILAGNTNITFEESWEIILEKFKSIDKLNLKKKS